MAKVMIKDGVINIDTRSMDAEEKNGVLKVLIDLRTGCTTMSMLSRDEDADGGEGR